MAEQQNNLSSHINDAVFKAVVDPGIVLSSPKSRNTTPEYIVLHLVIREILLILSEFNVQYINRSVGEFYTLLIILRMWIKKMHHEKNEEN